MDLSEHVETIRRQFAAAADAAGEDARAMAERLFAPLEASVRLALLDVLAAAADAITTELAPGSVEVRLRGREPEFVVTPAPGEMATEAEPDEEQAPRPTAVDGGVARVNVRMPEGIKARVDEAAASEGLSVNTWLVRAASAALERRSSGRSRERRTPDGPQSYTGWSR